MEELRNEEKVAARITTNRLPNIKNYVTNINDREAIFSCNFLLETLSSRFLRVQQFLAFHLRFATIRPP